MIAAIVTFIKILLCIITSFLVCMLIYNLYCLFELSYYSIRQEKLKLSFDDFYKFYILKKSRYNLKNNITIILKEKDFIIK